MRTRATQTTVLALTLTALLGARPSRAAGPLPTCDDGQFAVRGAPLQLGAGTADVDVVNVVGADGATGRSFVVRLGQSCQAVAVTQAPRSDAFILRARFEGCGERPRFRLRLAFDPRCATVSGRIRSAGQTVAEFTAGRAANTPGNTDATGDPTAIEPTTPPGDGDVGVVTTTPTINSFAPAAAAKNETIRVFGTSLDRDVNGDEWDTSGTPPYLVVFQSVDPAFGRLSAPPTFVSAAELEVRVPSAAISGVLVLAQRRADGRPGATITQTSERLIITQPAPAQQTIRDAGTPPATANDGTLHVVETGLSLFNGGDFPVDGNAFQIGAFFDANANHFVDLFESGRNDVPYLAFPVRSSEIDLSIVGGRGYFQGANAILWVFFEGGDPTVLDRNDTFFVVHLAIDLAQRTARPIAMLAGVAGDPGIVMLADQFSNQTTITVAQPGGGIGAIRGTIAAVPQFLQLVFLPSQPTVGIDPGLGFFADPGAQFEQRLWANGVTIDFDVPLFADGN